MNFTSVPIGFCRSIIGYVLGSGNRTRPPSGAKPARWLGMPRYMLLMAAAAAVLAPTVSARELTAGPDDYRQVLSSLRAGDTLRLKPGIYRDNLRIAGMLGSPQAPIVIAGNRGAPATIFLARERSNTISIADSSHVVIRDLVLEGRGLHADAVKCGSRARLAHHITIENLLIRGYGGSQQIVGISTKCPAWNWVIRGNTIIGAGTGMYLGDSDGSAPFVAGLIERNVVVDTLGYNLQIKHQTGRESIPAMPRAQTVIRFNTFVKAHHGSPSPLARPNVLLGHFPSSGAGSQDRYLVYGNFFYQNPTERLLQAEGNVAVYNNLFVNSGGDAISIQPHNDVPRRVRIFYNTVLARDAGILISAVPETEVQDVALNVVFAAQPLSGGAQRENVLGPRARAELILRAAGGGLPLDLHPVAMDPVRVDRGYASGLEFGDCDFDGALRDQPTAGAYAGPGATAWMPRSDQAPPTRLCTP